MGKILRLIVPMVLIAMSIVSCSRDRSTIETLTHVESIMQEHPDSALSLLQAIDTEAITTDRCRALHALLLSQAYDKNYIDLTSDSLISIAVEYYNEHGTAKERFLSLYYLGRVHYNAKNYAKAILAFTKAEQLISEFDDDFIKGLLYTQLGFIYEQYYDSQKALNAYQQSYFYYDKANKPIHRNYAKYAEATIYMEKHHLYEKTIKIYHDALKEAIERKDSTLISTCLGDLTLLHIENGQFEQANILSDSLLNNFSIGIHNSNLFSALSFLCAYNGNYKQSNQYMKIANIKTESNGDSVMALYYAAKIAALKKDYNVAYENLYNAKIIENRAIRKRLDHPILTIQKEYLEKELELNKLKQQHQLHTSILIGGIIIIVFVLLVYRWNKKYKQKLAKNITIAQNLREIMQTKASETQHIINNLLASRFDVIDGLCKTIYESRGTGLDKKKISAEIEKLIKQFSSDSQKIAELETFANEHYSNIITSFKTDLPNLKEADYLLFLYTTLGFSITAIALFLNEEKVDAVYNRKARLKNKIRNLGTSQYELYAKYLQ